MPGTVLGPRDRYSNDWKRQKINTLIEFTSQWREKTINKIKYIMCYMIIVVKKLKVDRVLEVKNVHNVLSVNIILMFMKALRFNWESIS